MGLHINIRVGTFETNSSSMHSLVISNKKDYVTEEEFKSYIDANGYFNIYDDENNREFECNFRILDSFMDKLMYFLAWVGYDDLDKLISALKMKYNGFKGFRIHLDEYTSSYISGLTDISDELPLLYTPDVHSLCRTIFGGIDHQSVDMLDHAIDAVRAAGEEYANMSTEEIIDMILFDNNFAIITDSDSSDFIMDDRKDGFLEEYSKILVEDYIYDKETDSYSTKSYFMTISDRIKELNKEYYGDNEGSGDSDE